MGRWPYRASNGVDLMVHHLDGVDVDITDSYPAPATYAPTFDMTMDNDRVRVGVEAHIDADPPVLKGSRVEVPTGPRVLAEAAISEYADVLAVAGQCRRSIRSPNICVALSPSDEEERQIFERADGLTLGAHPYQAVGRFLPTLHPTDVLDAMRDRLDGLTMLADSLSEEGALGRGRELFRFFERAFRADLNGCIPLLTKFLNASYDSHTTAYSETEVRSWFKSLRRLAVHADQRKAFARNVDVAPFLGRIEFAAIDVLFNKAVWRTASATRRDQQRFSAVTNRQGHTVVRDRGATILRNQMDSFGVFVLDTDSQLQPHGDWLWRLPGQ